MRRLLVALGIGIVLLAATILVRAARFTAHRVVVPPAAPGTVAGIRGPIPAEPEARSEGDGEP